MMSHAEWASGAPIMIPGAVCQSRQLSEGANPVWQIIHGTNAKGDGPWNKDQRRWAMEHIGGPLKKNRETCRHKQNRAKR